MKLLRLTITYHQTLAILVAGAFLFGAAFSMSFGMQLDRNNNMSGCPFMLEKTSVCSMGVAEHIAKWQQLFTAVFSKSDGLAFIILFLFAAVLFIIFVRRSDVSLLARVLSPPIPKTEPEVKLFNQLVVAFSQGILNPRLYA